MAHPAAGSSGTNAWGDWVDATLPGKLDTAAAEATYLAPDAYVPAPTGVFATDTANILAAANKLPSTGDTNGGTVILRAGYYSASLPQRSNVTFRGQGRRRTQVNCPTGSLLTVVGGYWGGKFESLALSTSGSHLINLGTTGYVSQTVFEDCSLSSDVNTAGIVNGSGSCGWQEVVMQNCELTMQGGATVSAFDIRSDTGGLNANVWEKIRANGNLNVTVPFWYIEATASYAYGNTFRQITSEQNQGGIIKILSPNGLIIENVHDYDATLYAASPIVIGKGGGLPPQHIRLSSVGVVGTVESYANVAHVEFTYSGKDMILDRVGDQFGNRKIKYPDGHDFNATVIDAGGASKRLRNTVSNDSLDDSYDGTLICNGANLIETLPDPATVPLAREFTVKNCHSTTLTVVSAGTSITIDGASSQSLAQWAKATYASDGTRWLTVAGNLYQPAWVAYTPTLVGAVLGNGSLDCAYQQTGKTVQVRFKFTLGSTSSIGTSPGFSLPVASLSDATLVATYGDYGTNTYSGAAINGYFYAATGYLDASSPFTWTTGDSIAATGTYEAA